MASSIKDETQTNVFFLIVITPKITGHPIVEYYSNNAVWE